LTNTDVIDKIFTKKFKGGDCMLTRVRRVRLSKGLKACELARIADVHASTLSLVENKRFAPTPAVRSRIAAALGVDEGRLFRMDGLAV
jgi:transcriptional regulator with XRE-family HTH domain